MGMEQDGPNSNAFVYLKSYDRRFQCFSVWETADLEAFSDFIEKMRQMTWTDIYRTASKGAEKRGLAYTVHKDRSKLPNQRFVNNLSPDITLFELRLGSEARVHGYRVKSAFCLILLDRGHEIYAQ